jgi:hypothetical protein
MTGALVTEAPASALSSPGASSNSNESDHNYRWIVAQLNDRWRVIACKDGIQWVLQVGKPTKTGPSKDWRGREYFRRRKSLICACATSAGPIDPSALAILQALPEIIGLGGAKP